MKDNRLKQGGFKMKKHTIYGLLITVTLVFCLSVAPTANAASAEEEVLQVATTFVKAFNINDYKLIYSLYLQSPKTSKFMPGKSGAFLLQGWDAIGEQCKRALNPEYPKGSRIGTLHNPDVAMLGDNVAVITGYITLTTNPPVEKEQTIGQIRLTFVVQKVGGKWYIAHEHTSALPTE
jgi:uncharacterized protein (TIGR02246 family)